MKEEYVYLFLFELLLPPIIAYLGGRRGIKRYEQCVVAFYWALREKYVHSYVNQNNAIKFVRKCCKLDTNGTIYWGICLFHYLQILMLISPILSVVFVLCIPLDMAIVMSGLFFLIVPACLMAFTGVFQFWEMVRCEKIKKVNPEYAKTELRNPWK